MKFSAWAAGLLLCFAIMQSSRAQVPSIDNLSVSNSTLKVEVSNLDTNLNWNLETNSTLVDTSKWVNTSALVATSTVEVVDVDITTNVVWTIRVVEEPAPVHPKIGQSAVFITRHHDVAGTATILDSSTIEITNFNYDATGLLVYIVVSPNDTFAPYTAVSGDLLRATPYVNETLTLTIPPGTDLSDINYISVWCVDVSVSFGDGMFL